MALKLLILVAAAFAPYILAQADPPTEEPESDNEIDSPIYRPCDFDDYKCIGDVLQHNSFVRPCKRPVNGTVPAKFTIPELHPYKVPYFNATYIDSNVIIRNFNNCVLREFFLNPVTDKAVLGLDCKNLGMEADRKIFKHKPLQEDDIFDYHFIGQYPLIRITVIWNSAKDMNIDHVYTLKEVLGTPRILVQSLDPDRPAAKIVANDLTPLEVYETESWYNRNLYLQRRFIQNYLCDYGYPYYRTD